MKPQADVFDIEGKSAGKISLSGEIFAAKVNPVLMAQAVRVFLSNQREARARARTRGQISGSTRKIYRQKGTGRARHGDLKAPIFVGGGKAHGPTGEQNYKKVLPKKMRRAAISSALTAKFKSGEVKIIEGLESLKGKTKEINKIIEKLTGGKNKKGLLVLSKKTENIIRCSRNINGLKISQVKFLNTYQILNGGVILFTKEAAGEFDVKKHS